MSKVALTAGILLALIVPLAAAAPPAGPVWAGTWSVQIGTSPANMTLLQQGTSVAGTFGTGASLNGTASGQQLTGTWKQTSGDNGQFVFTMDPGNQSFKGIWKRTADADYSGGLTWNGTCVSGRCREPNGPPAVRLNVSKVAGPGCGTAHGNALAPLKPGQQLTSADRIICGPAGSATIAFSNGSKLLVGPASEIRVSCFFRPGCTELAVVLLRVGTLQADVPRVAGPLPSMQVRTLLSTATTQGARFTMSADLVAKVNVLSVTKGLVKLEPANTGLPIATVPAGREVQVGPAAETKLAAIGEAGTPPTAISRAAARQLVLDLVVRNTKACNLVLKAITVGEAYHSWKASVLVSGKTTGWGSFNIVGRKLTPVGPVAEDIVAGCRK